MKYYNFPYPDEHECVYPIDYFVAMVEDNDSIIIEEQKRDYGNGFMWCKVHETHIESGDGSCGILCPHYDPCNGRTGRCSQLINTVTGSGKMIKISCFNGKIQITDLEKESKNETA